jgi:AraC-like DNA-binding protein
MPKSTRPTSPAPHAPLHFTPLGDTAPFTPSVQRPVRIRARTMPADSHFEPHHHAWAQLAYCATGIVQVTAQQHATGGDQVTYIVPPSRAVWIAPGAQHAITVIESAEFCTLYIDPSVVPAGWSGCRVMVVSNLMRELIHALDVPQNPSRNQPLDTAPAASASHFREPMIVPLLLHEITHATIQALGVPMPHPQSGDKRLRALCEAVLRAPAARATLAEWAVDIGASERTVARLFRTELCTSFQQWRTQAVLAHALPLLARGSPVSNVAALSGYASDSAFSAMFKAAMGQSPSHFIDKTLYSQRPT